MFNFLCIYSCTNGIKGAQAKQKLDVGCMIVEVAKKQHVTLTVGDAATKQKSVPMSATSIMEKCKQFSTVLFPNLTVPLLTTCGNTVNRGSLTGGGGGG